MSGLTAEGVDMDRRAVVIRSGGLGDFVLTLPLLARLRERLDRVTLVTRAPYRELIRSDGLATDWLDIDSAVFASLYSTPSPRICDLLRGSRVYSFLPDPDGVLRDALRACGAEEVAEIDPRPQTPPHFVARMLWRAGLGDDRDDGPPAPTLRSSASAPSSQFPSSARPVSPAAPRALWLHTGSGSPAKNAPVGLFVERARKWLDEGGQDVIVSFGEADADLLEPAREAFRGLPCRFEGGLPLPELRTRLESEAARYVGNDSGVTHLAAALGVPTEAIFVSTDPAIWAPLGRHVQITIGSGVGERYVSTRYLMKPAWRRGQ